MSRLPVLFTAHGNPMNALGTTPFASRLREWAVAWPEPAALLVGSGNLVHNLREADLSDVELPVKPWAAELDRWVGGRISAGDVDALATLEGAPEPRRAHPTLEHYAPVVVCAAAAGGDAAAFPITGFEHASLSLRCVRRG